MYLHRETEFSQFCFKFCVDSTYNHIYEINITDFSHF